MASTKIRRRGFVTGTAALSSALVAAPFVRGAYAAGKLSIGFWDHWVPNANDATERASLHILLACASHEFYTILSILCVSSTSVNQAFTSCRHLSH